MWTPATRAQHTRVSKRYQTDLSDAEWALIAAFVPEARTTGRRRQWPMREIVNAIFYVLRGGIAWRRHTSAVVIPASCSFNTAMICSSLNLLRFIRPSPCQGRTLLITGGNLGAQTKLSSRREQGNSGHAPDCPLTGGT